MSDPSQLGLRKADFWTALVLILVAAGMLAKALAMPLEGTYAGVRNVWYVSPALMPIGIAAGLIVLATILLLNAVRTGGAAAALASLREPRVGRFFSTQGAPLLVVGILAAYIYVLIPRIDFVAATTLILFTFVATFDLGSAQAARRVIAVTGLVTLLIASTSLAGFSPEPRSPKAYARDAMVWIAVAIAMGGAVLAAYAEPSSRAKLRRCLAVSLITPLLLGTLFKYGFLAPLPTEGLTIEGLERIRYGIPALLSR